MKIDQSIDKETMLELENSSSIEKTAKAIANGDVLVDVRVDAAPLHYHPWLSELSDDFGSKKAFILAEQLILDQAVLAYSKHGTLRMSTGGFLENALNGNVKQFKKDIDLHAVDQEFDDNHVLTGFKIKLKDITVISIMNIIS